MSNLKKINKLIEEFLKTQVKIESGQEDAVADQKDVDQLQKIVELLCEAKWEPNYRGTTPVKVSLLNKSTHENQFFFPIPRNEDGPTIPEYNMNFEERIEFATTNLKMATDKVTMIWADQQKILKYKKAAQEGKYCHKHGIFEGATCEKCPKKKSEAV